MLKRFFITLFTLFAFLVITPPTFADDSSIVPVLWLFAKNGKFDGTKFEVLKEKDGYIYEYDYSSHSDTKKYYLFGSNIYEYDYSSHSDTKKYYLFGGNVYEYDYSSHSDTKKYYLFGRNVYEYDYSSHSDTKKYSW